MFREIAACGSPVFLSNIAGRVTSIVMNISLMTLGVQAFGEGGGTTAVAVYAVLMYASDLCWPLLYGISDSLSPAIGYNWGAQSYKLVKQIVRCAYIGTAIVGLISTSILFFFPGTIVALFTKPEDVLMSQIAIGAIRLFGFAYLFRWFVVTTQGFISAIEKPARATVMSVAVALVFPLLMLTVLWRMQLDGIWLNFTGVNALAAVLGLGLLIGILREIKRKEQNLIHKDHQTIAHKE
jgi:Na+-driven multidrug efflux pump